MAELPDIVIERVIAASRERIWKALTDPAEMRGWYHAGGGWHTPFAETDVRIGGAYRIGFSSPDNEQNFTMEGVFRIVTPPEKLVYTLGPDRLVSFTLEEMDGKTKLTLAFTPETMNTRDMQHKGWSEIMDHLVEHLA